MDQGMFELWPDIFPLPVGSWEWDYHQRWCALKRHIPEHSCILALDIIYVGETATYKILFSYLVPTGYSACTSSLPVCSQTGISCRAINPQGTGWGPSWQAVLPVDICTPSAFIIPRLPRGYLCYMLTLWLWTEIGDSCILLARTFCHTHIIIHLIISSLCRCQISHACADRI